MSALGAFGDVAVVGMAGRFPGADTLDQFWRNLRDSRESITFFSDEELSAAGCDAAALRNPRQVKAGPVLSDVEHFDAAFFEMGIRESELVDPQHRLFLECAWHALEDAGCDPRRHAGPIGVFAGCARNTYFIHNVSAAKEITELLDGFQVVIGSEHDFIATRTAFKLDLRGPAIAVQTACSTSLVAVHTACRSLMAGDCDMALAGAVSVRVPQRTGYLRKEGSMYSPDGHTRPFDAEAHGTVFGSGLGVVVLKPLANALACGDRIRAVIKGSSVNNDGADNNGITTPSVRGQATVIRRALAAAGVDADTIGYVEAHGTGTDLGDPVEINALKCAFADHTAKKNFCSLGSVKGNLGHLDAAAGMAGLIKTILSLEKEAIPASINLTRPNPAIDFENSPFQLNTRLTDWRRQEGKPRRAGVTALGFGGTNAHIILEEAPAALPTNRSRPWQVLMLSAKTQTALDTMTENLGRHLKEYPETDLADAAYTLQVGRGQFEFRRIAVCRSTEDAVAALETRDPKRVFTSRCDPSTQRPITMMFPGHGSHYVGMTRGLYEGEPVYRAAIDECAALFEPLIGLDLRKVLCPKPEEEKAAQEALEKTIHVQTSLFLTAYGLATLWKSWGIIPESVIGYSVGELVAACVAGVMNLPDAVRLVAARASLVGDLPPGSMLATGLPEAELLPLLGPDLDLGTISAPRHTLASGPREAIAALKERLAARKIESRILDTPHAFHSRMMDPILERYRHTAERIAFRHSPIHLMSTVTGNWAHDSQLSDPEYWVRELREPVRFGPGVGELAKRADRIFLETGPSQLLSALTRGHRDVAPEHGVLASCRNVHNRASDHQFILTTLGRLWLTGTRIDWPGFYRNERRKVVELPGYPFERRRFWIEPSAKVQMPPEGSKNVALVAWDAAGDMENLADDGDRGEPLVPGNDIERVVTDLWKQLLGVDRVGPEDNFLELGGNSLVAVQLISRLRDILEVEVPVREFLRNPTVAALAAAASLGTKPPDEIEQLLEEIEQLPPGEVDSQLAGEAPVSPLDPIPCTVGEPDGSSVSLAPRGPEKKPRFSLIFFSGDESAFPEKYKLVIEGAKFADTHGFEAVWTPERHFHRFGGLYPNPSVLSAALATVTKHVGLRGGSVITPLHDPVRLAEEWAVVDNLSGGRAGVAFASGFHPNDFILGPERFVDRRERTTKVIETVQNLWRGESIRARNGVGEEIEAIVHPRPVQPRLPMWLTATRATDTFVEAGKLGTNVLTALLRLNLEELEERIAIYRATRTEYGHDPDTGRVTLMVHTFLGTDEAAVRREVTGPFMDYLRAHMEFLNAGGGEALSERDRRNLLSLAFQRYYETSSLFGTVESCRPTVARFASIGVDEIACLVDFGIGFDSTLQSLSRIARLNTRAEIS